MVDDQFHLTGTPEYSKFIHRSRYSRWLEDENRRETWEETVDRYVSFFKDRFPEQADEIEQTRSYIEQFKVMPSMRGLMTAGKALDRDNVAVFNCSALAIDHPRAFDEIMYILMNGCGLGFSVERQFVSKLPEVAEEFHDSDTTIQVRDSKIGWAASFRELISLLYNGQVPKWDLSKLRPAGARLKTFGGRSSGPAPLDDLFKFTVNLFKNAAGRKLTSIECHDLACKIGEIVVVGGVRRCLPGTAKVLTTKGPKRIQDIKVNEFVVVGGKEGRVVDAAYSGVKKTIIINHRFGKLECTPEHKVAVFNSIMKYEFKRADEVVEGDRLVWDSVGFDGGYKNLPECSTQSLHFNASEFRIPNLNEDVAWLIGLIHGDGYISERSIEIAGNMKELHFLEKAADIFHKEFGLQASYGSDGRSGVGARLRVHSAALASWFFKYIKKANTPIRVPEFVMQSSKRVRFAYLAGLFDADGRARKDGALDATCTVYKDFAEDLVTLCATLGVAAFVSNGSAQRRIDSVENVQDFYTVRVVGNTNRENFIRGMDSLSMKLENHTASFTGLVDFSFPIRWAGTTQGYKANGNINVSAMRYDLPLLPSRVVSIEDGSEVPTWDIQVDELECFNTDGLVVHNSAMLSLSNVSDDRMRSAKSGQWWNEYPHRSLANNSACYTEKPDYGVFLKEWFSLYESKSGERGIFNRVAVQKKAEETGRRESEKVKLTNPCSEILLRDKGLCNLSEVVVRKEDSIDQLREKVKVATILGTMQASLTDFRYLRKVWKDNAEEEALLGVSLTGIMDHPVLSGADEQDLKSLLNELKQESIKTNKEWAKKIGINQSAAITCVKPSGCRPWDGLVTTNQGILTLEDILEDNHNSLSEWSSIEGLVATGAGPVTKSYINGEAPVLGINLSFGMSVESTPNHKWYVKDRGWVRADEIKKGDVLDITPGVYDKLTEAFLLKLNPNAINCRKDASTIIQPEKMSPDLAWLLGYLLGDGSMSPAKYRLRLIDARTENLEKAQSILKSVFGLDSTLHDVSEGRQAKVLEVGSKLLWHWLVKNGVWKYYEESIDIIPKVVRCSSKESIIAFLAGLIDADGWSSDSLLTYTTSSEDFSKHVQHVAWAVGVALGRSHNVGGGNFQKRKSMYLMSLLTNSENASLDLLSKHCSKMSAGKRAYNTSCKKAGVVQEVVPLDIKPTYDVETAEHWFFAGVVRSHNTVSQLTNTASGIHPRYSKYYIRRVRADKKDPIATFMLNKGFPCEVDNLNKDVYVFSFPVKAPESAKFTKDMGAMEQLRLWKIYQDYWCEHKPSITVYYTDDDFLEVGNWVWNNFDDISGISFLPYSGHVYAQAPYEEVSEEKYLELVDQMPQSLDWTELEQYEFEDNTKGSQTYACSGGVCEVVDLVEEDP